MGKNEAMTEANFISMVSKIVEEHGCKIVDIDFDSKQLNLDGPDTAVADCARALAEMLS